MSADDLPQVFDFPPDIVFQAALDRVDDPAQQVQLPARLFVKPPLQVCQSSSGIGGNLLAPLVDDGGQACCRVGLRRRQRGIEQCDSKTTDSQFVSCFKANAGFQAIVDERFAAPRQIDDADAVLQRQNRGMYARDGLVAKPQPAG